MRLAEIFYSIQAEGMLAGVPSIFVRTPGEPRCTWCATPEASWTPDHPEAPLGTIFATIRRQWCGHVVITGQEPLEEPDIEEFVEKLRAIDHHITVETSGVVFKKLDCDLMSITPLLKTAPAPKKKAARRPAYELDAIGELIRRHSYQLKFELRTRDEMEEVVHIVRETEAERERVMLIPAGGTQKALREQTPWVIEASRFFHYRYAPRLALP
ncbi:MAG: 7-carboxy-7-deazaguanine synthase QueE [Acidobacteria bacterium]|nr:7-carboxy-7-deazaguanine synthase QueE [Acidobacteriota bacterium]